MWSFWICQKLRSTKGTVYTLIKKFSLFNYQGVIPLSGMAEIFIKDINLKKSNIEIIMQGYF